MKNSRGSKKSKESDSSARSSYSWEHLLDSDSISADIGDAISLNERGPLCRPPVPVLRSVIHDFDDESMVSVFTLRDVARRGSCLRRVSSVGFILALLCSASFATTTWILDAFDLRPHIPPTDSVSLPHEAPTVAAQTERFAAIRAVLLSISTTESLSQLHTPQMKALDWIANRDALRLEPDTGHLLQRYALAVLYFATTELGWKRELNWLAPVHECEWSGEGGVRTCDADRRVTDVSLWNNLKGTLPVELGALSKLQILYLARNHLYGTVPTELGQLTELTYLGLQFNRLTGTFPSDYFGGLTKLRTIYLEKNDLTGTIKRTDPLCQLKFDASPPPGRPHSGGVLRQVTSDCRQLVKWKLPEVDCGCCSKCFAA